MEPKDPSGRPRARDRLRKGLQRYRRCPTRGRGPVEKNDLKSRLAISNFFLPDLATFTFLKIFQNCSCSCSCSCSWYGSCFCSCPCSLFVLLFSFVLFVLFFVLVLVLALVLVHAFFCVPLLALVLGLCYSRSAQFDKYGNI